MSFADKLKALEVGAKKFGNEEIAPFIVGLWDEIPAVAKKEAAHALVNSIVEHIRAHGLAEDDVSKTLGPKLIADVQAAIDAKIDGAAPAPGPDSPIGGGI